MSKLDNSPRPTIQGADRERLIKLLSLSGSPHDGEALAAIRKANGLLTANNTTWSEVIAQPEELEAAQSSPWPEGDDDKPMASPSLDRSKLIRQQIRRVPFLVRIALAPIWLTAEAAVDGVLFTPWPGKIGGIFGALIVLSVTGALWYFLVASLLTSFWR